MYNDHYPYRINYRKYNAVLDVNRLSGADYISLSEAKNQCKVDFTDEDTYITYLIKVARAAIEKYTGLSLVETAVTAILRNEKGGIELPYGPVVGSVASIVDDDEGDIEDSVTQGLDFMRLITPYSYAKLSYTAGYVAQTLPPDLKQAILLEIAFLYERRGDNLDAKTLVHSHIARGLAETHKRGTWLI